MGELIKLRLKRKEKKRSQEAEKASENRSVFGRSKAEKSLKAAEETRAEKALDGHKRDV